MLKELLRHSPLLGFYTFALALFVAAFALVVWRALRLRPAASEELARLALEGDEGGPES